MKIRSFAYLKSANQQAKVVYTTNFPFDEISEYFDR